MQFYNHSLLTNKNSNPPPFPSTQHIHLVVWCWSDIIFCQTLFVPSGAGSHELCHLMLMISLTTFKTHHHQQLKCFKAGRQNIFAVFPCSFHTKCPLKCETKWFLFVVNFPYKIFHNIYLIIKTNNMISHWSRGRREGRETECFTESHYLDKTFTSVARPGLHPTINLGTGWHFNKN